MRPLSSLLDSDSPTDVHLHRLHAVPQSRHKPPQMSLSFMLLMNVIFCMLAGAVYWASRVPAISEEVSMLFGGRSGSGGTGGRTMHVIFVMFTYTAPLLLAGLLSTLLGVWRYFERRRAE